MQVGRHHLIRNRWPLVNDWLTRRQLFRGFPATAPHRPGPLRSSSGLRSAPTFRPLAPSHLPPPTVAPPGLPPARLAPCLPSPGVPPPRVPSSRIALPRVPPCRIALPHIASPCVPRCRLALARIASPRVPPCRIALPRRAWLRIALVGVSSTARAPVGSASAGLVVAPPIALRRAVLRPRPPRRARWIPRSLVRTTNCVAPRTTPWSVPVRPAVRPPVVTTPSAAPRRTVATSRVTPPRTAVPAGRSAESARTTALPTVVRRRTRTLPDGFVAVAVRTFVR